MGCRSYWGCLSLLCALKACSEPKTLVQVLQLNWVGAVAALVLIDKPARQLSIQLMQYQLRLRGWYGEPRTDRWQQQRCPQPLLPRLLRRRVAASRVARLEEWLL